MGEKILLVEDEEDLQRAVEAILKFNKYNVVKANNGEEAIEKVKNDSFDIIVIDIMMPVMDGISALKEIRNIGINTPVILLTAKTQVDEKVEGLDAGANDYLTKPFDKKELLARIRALTRTRTEEQKKFKVGNINFNKGNSEIFNENACYKLNNKECEIMEILVKNQERPVNKNEISSRLWKEESDEQVTMYMSFLKDKLKALNADIKIDEKDGFMLEKIQRSDIK